jgi:AgrD protein
MKNIMVKFAGVVASLALMVTAANVNMGCMFIMHQPKLPEGAEKLRKF